MIPDISQESLSRWKALTDGASKAVVLGHTHPDGDALGSCCALAVYLQEKWGKQVHVVFPDSPADNLRFIVPASCRLVCQDTDPEGVGACIGACDLVFLLDCNGFSRTEGLEPLLRGKDVPKILVDHHLNPERDNFDLVFSTPDISSASELLYWILTALDGGPGRLPSESATALLAGMTTDTNNFANSVYPSTFRMASELIAAGVDRDSLLQKLYNSYRENRVRIFGYMQLEGLHIVGEAAYMVLTRDIQRQFDIREGETEGLVNVPLSIAGVRLSLLLKEDDGHFRVSIRSKKGTSAQRLASGYFHGGGHENAAGGKLLVGADIASPAEASAYVESALKTFLS